MLCGRHPKQSNFVLHTHPDTKSTRTTTNRGRAQSLCTQNGASAQSGTQLQDAVDIL